MGNTWDRHQMDVRWTCIGGSWRRHIASVVILWLVGVVYSVIITVYHLCKCKEEYSKFKDKCLKAKIIHILNEVTDLLVAFGGLCDYLGVNLPPVVKRYKNELCHDQNCAQKVQIAGAIFWLLQHLPTYQFWADFCAAQQKTNHYWSNFETLTQFVATIKTNTQQTSGDSWYNFTWFWMQQTSTHCSSFTECTPQWRHSFKCRSWCFTEYCTQQQADSSFKCE